MIKYSITMGIRVVCIIMMLFVQGWWLLVFALGAILLPYIAVVIANVHADPRGANVYRPGAIELFRGDGDPEAQAHNGDVPRAAAGDDAATGGAGTDRAGTDRAGTDRAETDNADRRDADGSAA